jgi:hypothetical protein
MKVRRRIVVACTFAALAAATPLRAQAPMDTTLARAVASVLADSLLDRVTRGPIVWRENSGPIDLGRERAADASQIPRRGA